jgi:hypothetical protein
MDSGRAKTKKVKTSVSQTNGYTELNAAIETTVFRKQGKEFIQMVNNCIKPSLIVVANVRNIK